MGEYFFPQYYHVVKVRFVRIIHDCKISVVFYIIPDKTIHISRFYFKVFQEYFVTFTVCQRKCLKCKYTKTIKNCLLHFDGPKFVGIESYLTQCYVKIHSLT